MKWLFALLYSVNVIAIANAPVVNMYNWSDYLPQAVIEQFEKETGIHVNYSEFENNETLYTKLKINPMIGFDIIVPSSYYVERMRREHMLRKLDKMQLPNIKYLNKKFLNYRFDQHNQYSLPYTWNTTGMVINDQYHTVSQFQHWKAFWESSLKNQLLMLNDPREIFAIAFITLGYSINDNNPKHIAEAYQQLRRLLPNIKLFNSDAINNIYIDEDADIGMGWNGNIYQVQQENKHIQYIYPKPSYPGTGGFPIWIDCLAVPIHAPHYHNAMRLINFLMRPDIAAKIAQGIGLPTANKKAMALLPKNLRNNIVFNPPNHVLDQGEVASDLGIKSDRILEEYWNRLKLGG